MERIDEYLLYWKDHCPEKIAVVIEDLSYSYSDIYGLVSLRMDQLKNTGMNCSNAWVCRASQDCNFLVTYLAVHLMGHVMVPLEASTTDDTVQQVMQLVSSSVIPDGTSDILFTTGTTGKNKGVIVSADAILADAENLADAQGFSHDLMVVISGPLNHLGSLSKIWPTLLVGGTLYITQGMKDINAFLKALDYPCQKVATFLVPASIRILLTFGKNRLASYADKVEFIETGAAPICQSDMEALCQAFPNSRLYNTYASTETGIVCTHNYNEGLCVAGCLGRPMKHSSVIITDEGKVACQGRTLMTGYVGDEKMTQSVLRDGVVYTNDCGRLDADGRLHLSGRNDDVINVGGFKVSPIEVEDAAMAFHGIQDCVCIPTNHILLGKAPKLLVVLSEGVQLDKRAISLFLSQKLESYKIPIAYEQVDAVHRTYNGKIDRKSYL